VIPKNIAVVFVTENIKKRAFDYGLDFAKKFYIKITILQSLYRQPPKFAFFETKGDEKRRERQKKSCLKSLEDFVKMGEKFDIAVKTKVVLSDPISKGIISYVNSKDIDLVILDSLKLKSFEEVFFGNIISELHKNLKCPILLLN
jgi:nucleotide-binding universal stress UspA family protein